jgi:hypothetical protein
MKKFEIEILTELSDELLEYIFDCWVAFVTNDLGLQPNELPITLTE